MRSNTYSLNGHMPTDGEYLEYMRVVANHSPGDFLITRTAHVRYLQNGDAANVLAHILNLLRMKHSNEEDQERLQQNIMWIKCPLKSIAAQLNLGKHQAPAAVKALVKAGVLETDNRGVPQTMWVRVSAEKLVEIERWNLQYEAELRGKTQKPKKRVSNNPESGALETQIPGFYNTNNPPNNLPLTGEAPASEPNSNSRGNSSSKTNNRQSNQTAEVETSKTNNSRSNNNQPSLLADKECREHARRLRSYARSQGWEFNGREDTGAACFCKHIKNGCKDLPELIDWYCGLDAVDREELGLPSITSCNQFCRLCSWIRDKRSKQRRKDDPRTFYGEAPSWALEDGQ